jgi:hypothetical protein
VAQLVLAHALLQPLLIVRGEQLISALPLRCCLRPARPLRLHADSGSGSSEIGGRHSSKGAAASVALARLLLTVHAGQHSAQQRRSAAAAAAASAAGPSVVELERACLSHADLLLSRGG